MHCSTRAACCGVAADRARIARRICPAYSHCPTRCCIALARTDRPQKKTKPPGGKNLAAKRARELADARQLQSKTVTKLILSLGPRSFPPYFTLSTIYVLASCVKLGLQLRVIGFDPQRDNITHLTSLQHPSDLGIWENCYDGTDWSDALRDEALTAALGGARPEELDPESDEDE